MFASTAYGQVDVVVHRYDNFRTNQNLSETILTTGNVNSTSFGKVYSFAVDGFVYAQPLYKSNVSIPSQGIHNVVYIATQHDSVFAFDADTAAPLWQVNFTNPAAGVTTIPIGDMLTSDLIPDTEVGIMSTPVIDPVAGTLYVVAGTKENGNHVYRIHALDMTTGTDKVPPTAIQGSVPGTGFGSTAGTMPFHPEWQLQRPGLSLANGNVYVGFGSSSDNWNWHGWLFGFNATTLANVAIFCTTPDGLGGGVWAAGEAPPVDASGNLFFSTGNGDFDGSTNYGDTYVKLGTASGLTVLDFFSPFNQQTINAADLDIASAGIMLLPDSAGTSAHPHIAVGGGKDGTVYLVDRDRMGGFNGSYTNPDSQIIQEIWNAIGAISINVKASALPYVENNYSTPAFWQNHLYWVGINDKVKMFTLTNGLLSTSPVSTSATTYPFGGAQPVVTANSSTATTGVLWAIERGASNNILHAYNATNLTSELYNSSQAAGNRDQMGASVKFIVPTVANGKVFVGSQDRIDVFGLLASTPAQTPVPAFTPVAGGYTTSQNVTITDTNTSAAIYYTLDGSIPTASSTRYTGPIAVSATSTTIRAIALASGLLASPVATATYRIGGTLVTTGGFVQGNYADPQSSQSSVSVPFLATQSAGNMNLVVVGWNDTTAVVSNVTDTVGNVYKLAVGPTVVSSSATQSIYYAPNISSAGPGANSVTVRFNSAASFPDIRIAEYTGLDPNNPLDVTASATGNNGSNDSGPATTTAPIELLVGANLTHSTTTGPGAGFVNRMTTVPDGDILEDMVATSAGTYHATASTNLAGWIMQMATFRAAPSAPVPTAPTNLTPTAASSAEIDLLWTISTETGGTISQYLIERCQGTGCSTFTQVGTSSLPSFADTGLSALTSYTYRVRAMDSTNNLGPYSSVATATTLSINAPTAPTSLAALAASSTVVNLTWTASTPSVGTISNYLIERCTGNRCILGYAQIGTSATTSFSDTSAAASTTYTYRVRAIDSAGNFSPYSSFATATTPAPTVSAPSNLSATVASSTQINLSWTASSGTISQYLIESCSGASCSNFTQIGTSTTTTFSNTGLLASTSYSYRVRATDGTNFSSYSNTATAATSASAPPSISLIQINSATPQSSQSTVTVKFTVAQLAGDLNVVVVGWNDSTATVSSVTDTLGNVYARAVGPTVQSGTATQSIYYAKNIVAAAANANTVTIRFSASAAFPDICIAEYSGLDTGNPLDVSVGASGSSASSSSGSVTTTYANDLLIGANVVQTSTTGAGAGYTSRLITNPDGDIFEDRVVTATGSYSATATVSPSGQWIMQLVAFRGASSGSTPTAPGSLTATAAGPVQINLSWTASTEAGGTIANYLIERCSGPSCTTFAQVATSPTTTYSDSSGLLGSTSYSYRVRAADTNNVTGPYSNTASATTAAPTFVAPSGLTATAAGSTQINLSWTAATEAGGTITQYLIESCSVASCSNFVQIGTSTTTTFSNTGLLGSTSYSYRVRATDGTNSSSYSNTASATTPVPTFVAPSSLTATAAGSTQINLSWTAATEAGGTITQYLIESCSLASCSNFAQIGTSTTTTFSNTGLLASTSYSYRVRATDGTNFSSYSNIATAATSASAPTAPGSLTATAAGPVQINLSWTASTEAGGTIANYLIERCSGPSCTTFAQVATSPTTTYSDSSGLLGSTSYSYRVRAADTNNITGPYSNTASATTAAPTFVAPSGLAATAASNTQINLSWTAATETGGTLTQYLIERCSGASCTTFASVGTSTTTTFSNTGLLGSTSYSYRVRATDGTNFSSYSNTASATTPVPTFVAPSGLTATAAGSTQINLSWTAATEAGGTITQYLIESCSLASCSNFAQIGTSTTTTFSNTGLLASTSYSYRVRATDGTNFSSYSNIATAATSASGPPSISLIQINAATPQSPQSTVAVNFTIAQLAGDLNVVVVGWNDSTATVSSVTDTLGNVYARAVGPTVQSGTATQSIYYAKNIVAAAANANTVTVRFSASATYPDIRIAEYSGLDTNNPLDVSVGASGSSASSSSGSVTTTYANDLLIGANVVQTSTTGAGAGYTSRLITNPDGDIFEDRVVTATGSYSATATVSPSGQWIMQLVAFKAHP